MQEHTPFSVPAGFRVRGAAGSAWRQADLRMRALVVLLAILAIPVLILIAVAVIAIMLVTSILVAASALVRRFTAPRAMDSGGQGRFGRSDDRENVRIIPRRHE